MYLNAHKPIINSIQHCFFPNVLWKTTTDLAPPVPLKAGDRSDCHSDRDSTASGFGDDHSNLASKASKSWSLPGVKWSMIKLFVFDVQTSSTLRFVALVCWSLDACYSQLRWQRRPTGQPCSYSYSCSYSCSTDWCKKTKHRSPFGEAKDFSKGCEDDEGTGNVIKGGGKLELTDPHWPLHGIKIGGRALMRKKQRHNKSTLGTRKREAGVVEQVEDSSFM